MKRTLFFLAGIFMFCHLQAQQTTSANTRNEPLIYPHVFNPLGGIVDDTEKPVRDALCLNGSWQFMPVYETDIAKFIKPQSFSWDNTPIKVPSPWNINSFAQGDGGEFLAYPSYPKDWEKATMENSKTCHWKKDRITS